MGGESGSNGTRPGPATARLTDDEAKAVEHDDRLYRLFARLDEGLATAPNFESLAEVAECAESTLRRICMQTLGRTCADWVERWRVDDLRSLLGDGRSGVRDADDREGRRPFDALGAPVTRTWRVRTTVTASGI